MFEFLKRSTGKQHSPDKSAPPKHGSQSVLAPSALDPLPVPEVTEGNSDTDWSAWEDSVVFQDSQIMSQEDAPTRPVSLEHRQDSESDNVFEREASRRHR